MSARQSLHFEPGSLIAAGAIGLIAGMALGGALAASRNPPALPVISCVLRGNDFQSAALNSGAEQLRGACQIAAR